jgi:hypothetical protein
MGSKKGEPWNEGRGLKEQWRQRGRGREAAEGTVETKGQREGADQAGTVVAVLDQGDGTGGVGGQGQHQPQQRIRRGL